MTRNGRAHALGWAAVIIGALLVVRMMKGAGEPPYGIDASYYFQLARHVADGDGLVTTVSLYHEGWALPARTPIYPLWPLLLGYTGRAIGLAHAADLLPRLFYAANLVLLYFLAHSIAVRMGTLRIGDRWWMPDCAHWIVAIFGLAPRYFAATTHPYTEGLAFAMAFSALLALERHARTGGLWAAAASGVFAGLAFLARTQMVGIAIGCFLALVWFALRAILRRNDLRSEAEEKPRQAAPRGSFAGVAAWSAAALATVAPWFMFLGFIPGVTPMNLPRVTLPKFEGWTELSTRTEWLAHRATSLGVMFDPFNQYSYVRSFGIVAFLVPLALIVFLLVRRNPADRPAGAFGLTESAVLIAGVFFFFNLMLYHSEVWMPWLFGWRHGLPYVFLIALSVPFLVARSGRMAPAIAIVLLVSVLTSARSVAAFVRSPDVQLTRGEDELVRWLSAENGSAITTNAQILGSMTDAHLYWTHCKASPETTRAMMKAFGVRHVILYEHERSCGFAQGAPMRLVSMFGDPGRRVFVLAPLR